jgi:hypothetical protein
LSQVYKISIDFRQTGLESAIATLENDSFTQLTQSTPTPIPIFPRKRKANQELVREDVEQVSAGNSNNANMDALVPFAAPREDTEDEYGWDEEIELAIDGLPTTDELSVVESDSDDHNDKVIKPILKSAAVDH